MKRKIFALILVSILMFLLVGCAAHIHKVGTGGQGNDMKEARQWYVLWGLVPINDVDSAQMAGSAKNYTIKTEQSPLDVVINIFTSAVTVYSRTVTVTK
jgi:hypothetical protein